MWYYLENGAQRGPVDQAAFDGLVSSGVILPATFVWRDGQPEWRPWQSISPGQVPMPASMACSICHKAFPPDEVIELAGQMVCGGCKPIAVQSLREGVPAPSSEAAWVDGNLVVVRDRTTLPRRCYKCNEPTSETPLLSRFVWHHPALHFIWFGLIFNVLVTVIGYAVLVRIIGRRGSASICYCKQHLRARKRNSIVLMGVSVAIGLTFSMSMSGKKPLLALGTLAAGAIMQIVWIRGGFIPRAKRLENATLWLTSAGRGFLASLPQWPG